MDSRECTPDIVRVAMYLAAETRSFERGASTMTATLGVGVSAKTIERLVGQIGEELSYRRATMKIVRDTKVRNAFCEHA